MVMKAINFSVRQLLPYDITGSTKREISIVNMVALL